MELALVLVPAILMLDGESHLQGYELLSPYCAKFRATGQPDSSFYTDRQHLKLLLIEPINTPASPVKC